MEARSDTRYYLLRLGSGRNHKSPPCCRFCYTCNILSENLHRCSTSHRLSIVWSWCRRVSFRGFGKNMGKETLVSARLYHPSCELCMGWRHTRYQKLQKHALGKDLPRRRNCAV